MSSFEEIKTGIIGPGNIGSDLLIKLLRSKYLKPELVVNTFDSDGIKYAKSLGVETSTEGLDAILNRDDIKIVFDCTSAAAHIKHAPLLKESGKIAIDLTPAAVGPYCVPSVNLTDKMLEEKNVNMITCAGQATVPIVAAISRAAGVEYAEIVSSISSKSIGPGTRESIDEFTVTTKKALINVGGAEAAKVIVTINPAEPPIFMRNTIYAKVKKRDIEAITDSVNEIVEEVKAYVPGYKVILAPIIQDDIVTTMIEVEGSGDFLPPYAGNLDMITAAAVETAEQFARKFIGGAAYV